MLKISRELELAFRLSGRLEGWRTELRKHDPDAPEVMPREVPELVREVWERFGDTKLLAVDLERDDLVVDAMEICGMNSTAHASSRSFRSALEWAKLDGSGPLYSFALDVESNRELFMDARGRVICCLTQVDHFGAPLDHSISEFAKSIEEALELIAFGRSRSAPPWLGEAVAAAMGKPCRFRFSEEVAAVLRRNGWYPDRHVPTAPQVRRLMARGYAFSPLALAVLESLGGMSIDLEHRGRRFKGNVIFEPYYAAQDPYSEIKKLEEHYGEGPWSPLGLCLGGYGEFMLTATGEVIGSGGGGIEPVGRTFEEAMEVLVLNKNWPKTPWGRRNRSDRR